MSNPRIKDNSRLEVKLEIKAGYEPIQDQDVVSCKIINVTERGYPINVTERGNSVVLKTTLNFSPYNQQSNALPPLSEFFKKPVIKAPWIQDVLSETKKPRQ
jgi:hypothetical protein